MVTLERAWEILTNGSFSYDITNFMLEITPCKENGDLICRESFTINLNMIDKETLKTIINEEDLIETPTTTSLEVEYELNSGYIYDEDNEIIGENNFVVKGDWLYSIYQTYFTHSYPSFKEFINEYDADKDGEFIYNKAFREDAIVEDLGEVYTNN